jgi:hypothetical protein
LAAGHFPAGRFFAAADLADFDCLPCFPAADEDADFFPDFFFEPPKILSHPSENFSVEPVWTVYPVILGLSCYID